MRHQMLVIQTPEKRSCRPNRSLPGKKYTDSLRLCLKFSVVEARGEKGWLLKRIREAIEYAWKWGRIEASAGPGPWVGQKSILSSRKSNQIQVKRATLGKRHQNAGLPCQKESFEVLTDKVSSQNDNNKRGDLRDKKHRRSEGRKDTAVPEDMFMLTQLPVDKEGNTE